MTFYYLIERCHIHFLHLQTEVTVQSTKRETNPGAPTSNNPCQKLGFSSSVLLPTIKPLLPCIKKTQTQSKASLAPLTPWQHLCALTRAHPEPSVHILSRDREQNPWRSPHCARVTLPSLLSELCRSNVQDEGFLPFQEKSRISVYRCCKFLVAIHITSPASL